MDGLVNSFGRNRSLQPSRRWPSVVVCELEEPSLLLLKVGGAVLQHCGLHGTAIGCSICGSSDSLGTSLKVCRCAVLYKLLLWHLDQLGPLLAEWLSVSWLLLDVDDLVDGLPPDKDRHAWNVVVGPRSPPLLCWFYFL